MQQHLARVITVTSGKGGVGKSNVSVNLALQLSRLNKRVVILDADFGLANVEILMGIRPKYNLADLLFRGKTLREVICPGPGVAFRLSMSLGVGYDELSSLQEKSMANPPIRYIAISIFFIIRLFFYSCYSSLISNPGSAPCLDFC